MGLSSCTPAFAIQATAGKEELAMTLTLGEKSHWKERIDQREVEGAVQARARAMEADILSESDLGKQVLSLRDEKDNLLDTVWLATSCSQIKELWEQVNALLELKPTALEEKALSITPIEPE
jgi:hypothetical protein